MTFSCFALSDLWSQTDPNTSIHHVHSSTCDTVEMERMKRLLRMTDLHRDGLSAEQASTVILAETSSADPCFFRAQREFYFRF